MDHTDTHIKEKMKVGVGERQAASPVPASVAESWGNASVAFYICC